MIPLNLNSQLSEFSYIGKSTGSSFSPHKTGGWSALLHSRLRVNSWDGDSSMDLFDSENTGKILFSPQTLLAPGITTGGLNIPLNESKTIEFWFNSSAVSSIGSIGQCIFSYSDSNALAVRVWYYDDFGIWRLKVSAESAGTSFVSGIIDVNDNIRPGKWVHVAIVKAAPSTWSIFVSGKLIGVSSGVTQTITTNSSDKLLIGEPHNGDPHDLFDGQISNLMFFSAAKYTAPFEISSLTNSMPSCSGAELALFRGPVLKSEVSNLISGNSPVCTKQNCVGNYSGFTPKMVSSSPFARKTLGNSVDYVPGTTKGSIYFDGNGSAVELKNPLTSKAFGTGFDWTFGCWIYPEMSYDVTGLPTFKKYTLFSVSSPGLNVSDDITKGSHFYVEQDLNNAHMNVHVVLKGDTNPSSTKEHLIFSAIDASLYYNQWSSVQIINNNNTIVVVVNGIVIGKHTLTSSAYGNWYNAPQSIGARKVNTTYEDCFKGYISNPYYTSGSIVNGNLINDLSTKAIGQQLHPNLESFEYFSKTTPVNDGSGSGVFCLSSVDLEVYDISRKSTVSTVGSVFSSTDNTASSLSSYPSYEFTQTGYITTKATENNFKLNLNHDSFTIEAWVNIKALSSSDANFNSSFGQGILQLCSTDALNPYTPSVSSVNDIFSTYKIGMSLAVAGTDASNSLVLRIINSAGTVDEKTISYRRSGAFYSLPAGSSPTYTSALATNSWHHIALTYTPKNYNDLNISSQSGYIDVYIDGIKQNDNETLPINKDTILNTNYLIVGGHMTLSQELLGNVEELKIIKNEIKYKDLTFIPSSATSSETPLVTISTNNQIIDASTGAYLIVDNKAVSNFSIKLNGVDGVTFTDSFDPTNKANCKLLISTTNSVYCSSSEVFVGNSVVLSSNKNELFTFYYFNTGSLLLGFAPEDISLSTLMSAPTAYSEFPTYSWIDWNYYDWWWTNLTLPTTAVQYDLTSQSNGSKQYQYGTTGTDLSAWTSPASFYKLASGNNGNTVKEVTCSIDCLAYSGGTGNSQSTVQDLPVRYTILKVQKETGETRVVGSTGFLVNVKKQLHLTAVKKLRSYGWGWNCWASSAITQYESDGTSDVVQNLTCKFVCDGSWDVYVLVERPFIDSQFKFTNGTITETVAPRIGTIVFDNFQKTPFVSRRFSPWMYSFEYSETNYGKTYTINDPSSKLRAISLDSSLSPVFNWWNLWYLDLENAQWNETISSNIFDYWSWSYGSYQWHWYGYWSPYYFQRNRFRACGGSANFSSLPHLTEIYTSNSQLTSLNVTGCTNLTNLLCNNNKLSSLDVTQNSNLSVLRCGNNPDLVLTGHTSLNHLQMLHASNTKLDSLAVSNSTTGPLSKLRSIRLVDNNMSQTTVNQLLTNLDQRGDKNGQLWINGKNAVPSATSQLTNLINKNWDVRYTLTGQPTTNTVITGLSSIPQLKIIPDEGSVSAKVNPILGGSGSSFDIVIENGENLVSFDVNSLEFNLGSLNELNLDTFSGLNNITCDSSNLSSVKISDCKSSLKTLSLVNNNLTEIDLTNYTEIRNINVSYNKLTSLNVSGSNKLRYLTCVGNLLSSIEINTKPYLTFISCEDNKITNVKIDKCVLLDTIRFNKNYIDEISITNCPKLQHVNFTKCNMSTETIDKLLNDLVTNGTHDGYLYIDSDNETPSSAGIASISILQTRGWKIRYNEVSGPLPTDDFLSSTSTTGTLTLGVTSTGSIDFPRDRDWFKISGLTIGNLYTIYVDGVTLRNPELIIRNDQGKYIESITDGVGTNPRTSFVAEYSTYYFEVKGSSKMIGQYNIVLDSNVPVTPDPTIPTLFSVPGDHLCTSTAISALTGQYIVSYSDENYRLKTAFFALYRSEPAFEDWVYSIEKFGRLPQQYQTGLIVPGLDGSAQAGTAEKYLEVLSPIYLAPLRYNYKSSDIVACVKDIKTNLYYWVFVSASAKSTSQPWCYVRAVTENSFSSPESITELGEQMWEQIEGPTTFSGGIVEFKDYAFVDDFTNTVSTTGTLTVGTQKSGAIQFPGDHDWLKVTLSPGTTYYAAAASPNASYGWWTYGDLTLGLRNSSGNLVAYSDDRTVYNDANGRTNSLISFTVPTAGDYYLDVSSVNGITDYSVIVDSSTITPSVFWTTLANNYTSKDLVYGSYSTVPENYPLFGLRGENSQIAVSHKDKLLSIDIWNGWWDSSTSNGHIKFENYPNLERINMGYGFTKFETTACPKLSSINVKSKNIDSFNLVISDTQSTLKELNVSSCDLLDVTALSLQSFSTLKKFSCRSTKPAGNTTLVLPNSIEVVDCGYNRFNAFAPSSNLLEFNGDHNSFNSLNFTACANITTINTRKNNTLSNLQVTGLANLENLTCSFNSLNSLDLTGAIKIENIDCERNSIASLTLPSSVNFLTSLYCSHNQIGSLNLANCAKLKYLVVSDNLLNSLTLTSNIKELQSLYCNRNAINTLTLTTSQSSLVTLECEGNPLTTINTGVLTKLSRLNCSSTQITTLDLTKSKFKEVFASNCVNLANVLIEHSNVNSNEWWFRSFFDFRNNPNLTEASITAILTALVDSTAESGYLYLTNTRSLTNSQLLLKNKLLTRWWRVYTD